MSIINFSPGKSSSRFLTVNLNQYMSWSSSGYETETIAFPIGESGYIKNFYVSSIFADNVPPGSLLSVIEYSHDSQNIFTDTPLKVTTSPTNQCKNTTTEKFYVQEGESIALRVRYTADPPESSITQIELIYNATIEFIPCDNYYGSSIINYCNGGPSTFGSAPVNHNPFFLTFGGGNHADELFWTVPSSGILRNLNAAVTFRDIDNFLRTGQTIQFTIRIAKQCSDSFTDTALQCTLLGQTTPPTTAPFILCCQTDSNTVVPVAKGDRVSLRVFFAPSESPAILNTITGAGLQYIPNFHMATSLIRYNTNPTELLPNLSGTVESGTTIHYDTTTPIFSYFIAPHTGQLSNLFANYTFSTNSQIKHLNKNDYIQVRVFVTNRCNYDFRLTNLSCRLYSNKFYNSDRCNTVELNRGDLVSLVVRWVTDQLETPRTILFSASIKFS
ncbi:MAG: hypothetical protein Harvfovirus38_7 [Harvfovirus sp.]|uniref:Uncharacterized protein n=1 Tax=Harvfovirus sp. TaxID=2487768 RepID=A0A3G5A6P3_9VIRU|nr:MAG: hypothetical protein Harvfovirus38_7 [Harvfovirus sp.]